MNDVVPGYESPSQTIHSCRNYSKRSGISMRVAIGKLSGVNRVSVESRDRCVSISEVSFFLLLRRQSDNSLRRAWQLTCLSCGDGRINDTRIRNSSVRLNF